MNNVQILNMRDAITAFSFLKDAEMAQFEGSDLLMQLTGMNKDAVVKGLMEIAIKVIPEFANKVIVDDVPVVDQDAATDIHDVPIGSIPGWRRRSVYTRTGKGSIAFADATATSMWGLTGKLCFLQAAVIHYVKLDDKIALMATRNKLGVCGVWHAIPIDRLAGLIYNLSTNGDSK